MLDYSHFKNHQCSSLARLYQQLQHLQRSPTRSLFDETMIRHLDDRLKFLTFYKAEDQIRLSKHFYQNYKQISNKYSRRGSLNFKKVQLKNFQENIENHFQKDLQQLHSQTRATSLLSQYYYSRTLTTAFNTRQTQTSHKQTESFYRRSNSHYHDFHRFSKTKLERYGKYKSRQRDMVLTSQQQINKPLKKRPLNMHSEFERHQMRRIKVKNIQDAWVHTSKKELLDVDWQVNQQNKHAQQQYDSIQDREEKEAKQLGKKLRKKKLGVTDEVLRKSLINEREWETKGQFREVVGLLNLDSKERKKR